jgi:hypothetical protein
MLRTAEIVVLEVVARILNGPSRGIRPSPTKPPLLAYSSPTHRFAYMEEIEGEERECVIYSSRASS